MVQNNSSKESLPISSTRASSNLSSTNLVIQCVYAGTASWTMFWIKMERAQTSSFKCFKNTTAVEQTLVLHSSRSLTIWMPAWTITITFSGTSLQMAMLIIRKAKCKQLVRRSESAKTNGKLTANRAEVSWSWISCASRRRTRQSRRSKMKLWTLSTPLEWPWASRAMRPTTIWSQSLTKSISLSSATWWSSTSIGRPTTIEHEWLQRCKRSKDRPKLRGRSGKMLKRKSTSTSPICSQCKYLTITLISRKRRKMRGHPYKAVIWESEAACLTPSI